MKHACVKAVFFQLVVFIAQISQVINPIGTGIVTTPRSAIP